MRYTIEEGDLHRHREGLIALWKGNFNGVPPGRYEWIYVNNPVGPAIFWIARDGKGRIVGATSLFPRKFLVMGEPVTAGIAGDFVVDRRHRGFGPALSLQRHALSSLDTKGLHFLYGFPNRLSEPVLLKAGYRPLGPVVRMVRPLRSGPYIERLVKGPVKKGLSIAVDLFLTATIRSGTGEGKYACKVIDRFDERFDVLFSRRAHSYVVIGDRSSRYLTWRYLSSPLRKYYIFTMEDGKEGLAGYIVFYIHNNVVSIVDLFAKDFNGTAYILLKNFLHFHHSEGLDSVSITYTGGGEFLKTLKRLWFFRRDDEGRVLFYLRDGTAFSRAISECENWYLLAGDNDV